MSKTTLIKMGRAVLGIAVEIAMAVFIMAFALGISWLFSYKY